ncbi:MAG: TonB-dependent receptor [Gammaproteobacteria bacterium]|nr:TonB-dependent receptor [Gammaproteobacteria bacterium]
MKPHHTPYPLNALFLALTVFSCQPYAADIEPTPEMVVTATRVERQVFDTPQAVTVLDDLAVQQANAGTTPDILSGAEGVLIQKTNTGGGSPFIRGLTGKQVLIMVDGVRVNNSYYRFGPHQYLNTLDPNLIERIEVVRGPTSVLYGSDALGGVINVITRKRTDFSGARGTEGLAALHGASADGSLAGRLQVEGNFNQLGYLGGISGKRFNSLEGGGDVGEQMPTAYDELDGDLKLNYRLTGGGELIFAHQISRQFDVPKTSEVTLGDKLKFNYEPQLRSLSYLEYRGRHDEATLVSDVKLNVSFNRQKEGEEIVKVSTPTLETREITDVKTVGATSQFSSKLGRSHQLTYGFDFYRDLFDTRMTLTDLTTGTATAMTPGTPDGAKYESWGVYLQDEVRFTDRFETILGVRYAHFKAEGAIGINQLNLSDGEATGSINALYRLAPRWNLVGGVAQGYRAPSMEDFFGRVDFVSEIPNTQLTPEHSLNKEIGVKYYASRTSGDFYLFHTTYDDLIDRATVAPGVKQRQNIQRALIKGAEFGMKHAFSERWSTAGNLSYAWGEDRDTGEPLRRIPPLNGSLSLRYAQDERTWYEVYSLFADRQDRLSSGDLSDPRIPPGGTQGYATLNFKAGFEPAPGQDLVVSLENALDAQYKTHGSGVYAPGINLAVTWRVAL